MVTKRFSSGKLFILMKANPPPPKETGMWGKDDSTQEEEEQVRLAYRPSTPTIHHVLMPGKGEWGWWGVVGGGGVLHDNDNDETYMTPPGRFTYSDARSKNTRLHPTF